MNTSRRSLLAGIGALAFAVPLGIAPAPAQAIPIDSASVPHIKETFGAVGNGITDDGPRFATLPAGQGVIVNPGIYRFNANTTIRAHLIFLPGAVLRPESGVRVTFSSPSSITAGEYQIFDASRGGIFQGSGFTGWVKSSWFPGTPSRDLGSQLKAALDWNFNNIDVTPAPDHVIRTTVRLRHSTVIRVDFHNYPYVISCQTKGKPVFEAVGPSGGFSGVRGFRIRGGFWQGSPTNTPSCFLLYGRDDSEGQTGDTVPLENVHLESYWGIAPVINITSEVVVHRDCFIWNYGRGDFPATRPAAIQRAYSNAPAEYPHAAIIIGNADYWGLPFVHVKPRTISGSTSAISFEGCDIRAGIPHPTDNNAPGTGSTILIKGQVEDVDFNNRYVSGVGECVFRFEGGRDAANNLGTPRRISVQGGRTENNKGVSGWPGIPSFLVDGIDIPGLGVDQLTIGPMSHHVGAFAANGSTPVVKTIRGGVVHALNWSQGGKVFGTNRLIEHTTGDLNGANIFMPYDPDGGIVNLGTRAANRSIIEIDGPFTGTVGDRTKVHSSNVNNW
jgi:hypothetical protein